ncbi:iron chelate uptake ABC transporter family permease subunit [Micromonospora peucetia]|uniref:Iron chelate uptake ABC transporter family permease subunit n=1 Tax=Micromonospora peucetia TaxID=47871 RepID=A0ABZ1ENJ5_9ACTN|nr:iron chelate uptake ABC transporter family permease subunit [Micromonospora peucetia]MCX4390558.1 iron chelate uptake ABC transporter family permease subunit [Micromonospora peucetia]WSA35825.1 iron chelate uptake ABC transporter family permease subunit [Micromonospora peucetia]
MSATLSKRAGTAPAPPVVRRRSRAALRAAGLAASVLLLAAVAVLSIAVGAKQLPLADVWPGLLDPGAAEYAVVHRMRLPRTLLGLLAGAALGVAGAVMQALTRNPLADPGLLGINAGASAAVASGALLFGVGGVGGQVWFALLGAAVVTAAVYAVGGGRGATPARLALAGAALNATLYSYVSAVMLMDTASLERLRFWTVGSLASAEPSTVRTVAPFMAAGLLVALAVARPLNAMALGDDAARALGARPALVRGAVILAITLLCGAATAACGPIVFVGLLVPHLVRALTGPDLRWLLPYCAVLAPVLLLGADVLGRVLSRPGELQVGLVTAVAGGPLFLWLVLRGRVAHP